MEIFMLKNHTKNGMHLEFCDWKCCESRYLSTSNQNEPIELLKTPVELSIWKWTNLYSLLYKYYSKVRTRTLEIGTILFAPSFTGISRAASMSNYLIELYSFV